MIETLDHGSVQEIRIARPPVNALDSELLVTLIDALRAACVREARAIVVSGTPGMFSAGLDVPQLLGYSRVQMREFWSYFFGAQQALAACPVPVVAALTGHSPAGGAVLAIQCDHRVMAEGKYRIGLNEVQVGLYPGPTIYAALRRLVGTLRAAQERLERLASAILGDVRHFADGAEPSDDITLLLMRYEESG